MKSRSCIQVLCGMALLGTTWRYLVDYQIPVVFILLPLSLLSFAAVLQHIPSLCDPFTYNAMLGVITGVNYGFLSTVTNVHRTTVLYMKTVDVTQDKMSAIRLVEILHIPIIIIAIVDSFLRMFNRLPSMRSLETAAVATLVADLIVIIGLLLVDESRHNVFDLVWIFIAVYFHLLLLMAMPLFNESLKAWMLLIGCMSLNVQWQVLGLGSATWYWQHYSFPIPGMFVGLVYIFHLSRSGFEREEDACRQPVLPVDLVHGTKVPYMQDFQITSLHWMAMAFAFERVALHGIYSKHVDSDTVSACALLATEAIVLSPIFHASKTVKVLAIIAASLSYLCHTLVSQQLINACVLEIVLAIALVDIVNCNERSTIQTNNVKVSVL